MRLFVIGCSFSEGAGLKEVNDRYSRLLGNTLKINNYNIALSGSSNDYIFRKVFELLENSITKNDILIIQWTHFIRIELNHKYENINLYYNPPASLNASMDKIFNNNSVNFSHKKIDTNVIDEIDNKNQKYINDYILNFLNPEYQYNKTKNYIKSLYSYLELNEYKHLHFFGWDKCIIEEVLNYPKFINESFGGYTNTIGTEHPDKSGHDMWSNVLYNKLKELNYIK